MQRKRDPYKVVVLGEGKLSHSDSQINLLTARVGKSSLTLKYCKNEFDEQQASTVDATFQNKEVDISGERYFINLWDTAGQEKYHALNQMYYRGAHGAVLVYDVTDKDSFTKI